MTRNACRAAAAAAAAVLALLLAAVKLKLLRYWLYQGDIFMYDQMLGETLRGHFTLDFYYGRELGEHAYLTLLGLLPVKWALGTRFVYLLAALNPLAYGVCAWLWYRALERIGGPRRALVGAAWVLCGFAILPGVHEGVFGFHPDVGAAFLGLVAVAGLAAAEAAAPDAGPPWGALAAWALFAGTKEEFAVSACAALLLLRLRGRRWSSPLLGGALALTALDAVLLRALRTPLSRTDAGYFAQRLATPPAFFDFHWFWLPLAGYAALLGAQAWLDGGLDEYAAALVAMAAIRVPVAVVIRDYDPASWHNLPQFAFLAGAVGLQLARRGGPRSERLAAAPAALAAAYTLVFSVPVLVWDVQKRPFEARFAAARADAAAVIAAVEPGSVAAVPADTEVEWALAGRRFTTLPRGVQGATAGIARYVVLDAGVPQELPHLECFSKRLSTPTFVLYERRGACPELDAGRARFERLFGADALR